MNIKAAISLLICLGLHAWGMAQDKYFTRKGEVDFFSSAPLEDIRAENNGAMCVLDLNSGKVEVSLLIASFSFKKALMQEHFNENYMESGKHPKATFKGVVEDIEKLDLKKQETQTFEAKGVLSIKGVEREVSTSVTMKPGKAGMEVQTTFIVKPEDHDIKIPAVVRDNIAREIEVNVNMNLQPLER